jgi:hypothetical protein
MAYCQEDTLSLGRSLRRILVVLNLDTRMECLALLSPEGLGY